MARQIVISPPRSLSLLLDEVSDVSPSYRMAKIHAIAEFEHAYLARVIDQARGNVSAAARLAGTERRHFGRLLKKHHLDKPSTAS